MPMTGSTGKGQELRLERARYDADSRGCSLTCKRRMREEGTGVPEKESRRTQETGKGTRQKRKNRKKASKERERERAGQQKQERQR